MYFTLTHQIGHGQTAVGSYILAKCWILLRGLRPLQTCLHVPWRSSNLLGLLKTCFQKLQWKFFCCAPVFWFLAWFYLEESLLFTWKVGEKNKTNLFSLLSFLLIATSADTVCTHTKHNIKVNGSQDFQWFTQRFLCSSRDESHLFTIADCVSNLLVSPEQSPSFTSHTARKITDLFTEGILQCVSLIFHRILEFYNS